MQESNHHQLVKPGNTRSKITNQAFKEKQVKKYKKNVHSPLYNIDFHYRAFQLNNKTPKEAVQQNLCKIGAIGNRLSSFNFKKKSSNKLIYGENGWTYLYKQYEDNQYHKIKRQNDQQKENQKLRSQICLKKIFYSQRNQNNQSSKKNKVSLID